MKLFPLVILVLFSLSTLVTAKHRRRLLLRRQSSYNRFMRTMALNFEKAKVETLGDIFKRHVQQLRHAQNKQVELVFLIDSSGSVGSHYFYEELRFVKNLLADFTVDMNSTRVSVITFSSPHKIFRHIDYMSEPTPENHKCRLLQEDIPGVDYTAGGTHTLGAFLEAEKVLRSARAGATKVIFLMTDGYSNGGDPRPIAHKLKAQGVRIFTFGIRDGFVWELQDMASEPKNETCYILDSFEEFEALAKRALHTDLQSGSYLSQSRSKCGKLCNGDSDVCCHSNATCSCGTYTGKYECLCRPGFYGMGVGKAGCKPCPPGTYKNYTGIGACTACPDKHQMSPTGADSLSMCKCKKGYRNFGSEECTVFYCPTLSPPNHGYFVNKKCNNVFNAACGLRCNSGYELRGSSLRSCQDDGQWSGQPAECIMKTCPSLPQPKNGHMVCSSDDFSYSTVCRFACNNGYQLVGSRKRTCLAIAFWTGIATRCRGITCPPLVGIKDGTIQPPSCLSSEVVFGTICQVSCRSGYDLKGPHTKQCTPDGTWMASGEGANLCIDESPPILHCPDNIEASANGQDSLTEVFWTVPVPVDNSGLRPVITSTPSVSSGSKFPIGKTIVTYQAKDLSNNVAKCQFTIHVIDKTPPRIDKCLSPAPTASDTKFTAVDLEEPQFSDNSGKPLEVASSRSAKELFPMGKTKVVFTAFDSSNNNNTCVVNVVVVPHLCMTPDPPANGDITCKKGKKRVACQISCKEGYTFANKDHIEYSCLFKEGVWEPKEHFPYQDCSAVQESNDLIQPASITVTSDISCKDQQILSDIFENLEAEMKNKVNEACDNNLSCSLGRLSFVCEDDEDFNKIPQIINKRRRRSVDTDAREKDHSEKSKLSLKFALSGSLSKGKSQNGALKIQLAEALNAVLLSMHDLDKQKLDVKGKSVAIQEISSDVNDPEFQCEPGRIVVNNTCVSCPAGTYCSPDQKHCHNCPKGTFQDKENQTMCIRCPDDKSTISDNCRHVKECKALCRPGRFSQTGLEPCETCHQGFYQSDYGSRQCHTCEDGKTTKGRGTLSEESCLDHCPPGSASRTGLIPCYPCPASGYQPKVGQTDCKRCPGGGSTNQSGAINLSQCVRAPDSWQMQADDASTDPSISFNACEFQNPCKNGATCEPKDGSLYTCICQPGFAGETCDQVVDPCKGDPCLNGGLCLTDNGKALCVCLAGFTGNVCEENMDDCVGQPCQNGGTCLDGVDSFSCNCPVGFSGTTCKDPIVTCGSNPCLNGGSCSIINGDTSCSCTVGFTGELCDEDIDECISFPCHNDAACVDEIGGYSCTCNPGYTGNDCEQEINECESLKPCENDGNCVDGINDYTCNCPDGFTGKKCEEVLSPYYQLDFGSPSVLDYAQMTISQPLSAVTASFWMKTIDDDNQGTPFSYSVKGQPDAFTITDYKNLNIYINGDDVSAELRLNNGLWQHVVFTWSNSRGDWKIYVNGLLMDQGYDLSTKEAIPANGTFIIGQEQDEEGGGFSASETFVGSLTQLNLWDRELSYADIERLRFSCEDFQGNVIAWPKVQASLKGSLITSSSDFCEDCPKPESPAYGSVAFSGLRPNDDAVYSCEEGYNAAGRSEFKCLVSSEWESLAPACQPVSCGHPGSPRHGYIIGRDFSYGSRVRFRCNRGYELEGLESLTCTEWEEWDDDIPECVEIQCKLPLLSTNTRASVSSTYVKPGTIVDFSCTPGNKLLTEHSSCLCQKDGTFDKSIPTCDSEKCPLPPTIDNGEPKNLKQDYGVGENVQYQCSYGYRLDPFSGNRKGIINCLPNGGWDDDLPVCQAIICPDPLSLPNANVIGEGRRVDDEVKYQCDPGYKRSGRNSIVCQQTGEWNRLRLRCRPISCDSPPPISYGSVTGDFYTFGFSVSYQCDQGYNLDGIQERKCQEDGTWEGENPQCLPLSCGKPVEIENGKANYAKTTYSESGVYSCDPGYEISGTHTVTCEASGQWKPDPPSCNPRSCPMPPDVADASYTSPFELVFNVSVEYACNTGYVLSGSPVLVCNKDATWIPAAPVCEITRCLKPLAPLSGSVSAKTLTYSSIASYSCDNNFKLVGVDARTCQTDGTWSDDIPTCEATTCQKPENPLNGQIDFKDLSVGSIVAYTCDKGFKLVGESVRRCQVDLTFDNVAPTCIPVDCGAISPLKNGKMSLSTSSTIFGTVATFSCDIGYYLDGSKDISCGPDGQWSEQIPECQPVECPKVSKTVRDGSVIGSSFSYRSVLSYQCDEGYKLIGQADRTCQADKTWDNPAPSCQIITCPVPRLIYGTISTFDNTFGTTVYYACIELYRLEGPAQRTCMADGKWDGPDPKCLKIDCPAPQNVKNAESTVLNATAIQYACGKGYNMIGSPVRVCGKDEIWRPDAPTCAPSFCEDLSDEVVLNGQVVFSSAKVGGTVSYSCNAGYKLRGDKVRRCLSTGSWEGSAPECEKLSCGHPGVVLNGAIIGTDYLFNATVSFECDIGYKLEGVESIRCLETGYWESFFPYCEKVYCPQLRDEFENGVIYADSNSFYSLAEYSCKKGYILNGPKERECLASGEWSGNEPSCVFAICPAPEPVKHGIVIEGAKDEYGYGDQISYSCVEGYYISGKSTRYCRENGTWTTWIPRCYSIVCPEPPFIEHGYFEGTSAKYKSVLTFFCEEGYELVGDSESTCQLNATWSGSIPTCRRVSCGRPPSIANAYIDQTTNFMYEARVFYSCNEGFIPGGNNQADCLLNGTWSYIDFSCTIISCPSISPADVPHGIFQAPSFNFRDVIEFSCDEGYRLTGERTTECRSNGLWSSALPSCNIIQCPPLGAVDFGSVVVSSLDHGSLATVICNQGYILRGSSSLICLLSGLWNDSLPLCELVICPQPLDVLNGAILNPQKSYSFDHNVEYDCDFGYELQGSKTIRCTEKGIYDNPAPACVRIQCPDVNDIENGNYRWLNETFIRYSCKSGYFIEGDALRECALGGTWNSPAPFCKPVSCGLPPGIDNGEVIGSLFTFGNFVEYRCNKGYNLIGGPITFCEENGKWSERSAQCLPVSCGEPEGKFENGYINGDVYTYQRTIEYICFPGFEIQGQNIRTCQDDGEWSYDMPNCIRQSCAEPDSIPNGYIYADSFLFESVISYNCSEGFSLTGSVTRECESSLEWSGSTPSCIRLSCPPQLLANGYITGSSYLYGDVIQISCDRGFRLEGPDSRTCQADQSWSGVEPFCKIIYCSDPPAVRNAFSDYEQGNVYGVDRVVSYFCKRGYNMNGTGKRTCESTGSWSSNFLECYGKSCPAINDIDNGVITSDSPENPFTYTASLFFSCNPGFRLKGSESIECRYTGKWNEAVPACSIIDCETLQVENGFTELVPKHEEVSKFVRREGKYYAGDSAMILCDPGYEFYGSTRTNCSLSGKWASAKIKCQRVKCQDPHFENGIISGDSYLYTDLIQISCVQGYRLEGLASRTCQADKSWSGVDPVCKKIYCPYPPDLGNAFSDNELGKMYGVGSAVSYFCKRGYIMNGTGQRMCEPTGVWSLNFLDCYPTSCPAINKIDHGVITSNSPESPFTYTASLSFSCNEGFRLEGSPSVDCRYSGEWNEAIPFCSIIECEELHIENGLLLLDSGLQASFKRGEGKYYAGDNVEIRCNLGYEISGDSDAHCSLKGLWSIETVCNPVICYAPVITGAEFIDPSKTYKNKIAVRCAEGLDLIGNDELTCGANRKWEEELPRCELLACGSPSKVENAVLKGTQFRQGDTVFYECKPGYKLFGNNILTCGPSNQWLGSYPTCVKVDCGLPDEILYSYIDVNTTTFESIGKVFCIPGYELEGNQVMTCGRDRKWKIDPSTRCAPLDCGVPPPALYGSVSSDDTSFGSLAVYTCDVGYVIGGSSSMFCDEDGQWGYQTPVCSPVSCLFDPPEVAKASYSKNGSLYSDVVVYQCEEGYTFIDPDVTSLVCGDMGNWKGKTPSCKIIDCGAPPFLNNAFSILEKHDTTYLNIAAYICISGYESNASTVLTCSGKGTWEGSIYQCTRKNCFNYPDLPHGEYSQENGTLYGAEVFYTCHRGYEKTGPGSIECTSDGKWTNPTCAPVDCTDPPTIKHGQYQLDATTYESKAQYICDTGYLLVGPSTIECLDTGIWSPSVGLCKPLNCHDPPVVSNASVSFNSTLFGEAAAYLCDAGFFSSTSMSLSCGETGKWIGTLPACTIITCPVPQTPANGFVEYSTVTYLSEAKYDCSPGNKLIGDKKLICLESGAWSSKIPTCSRLECPQPQSIYNGQVTFSATHFGASALYSCLEGYILDGEASAFCNEKGSWNNTAPKCKIVDCKAPPPLRYGSTLYESTKFGSFGSYSCKKGYSLIGNSDTRCDANGSWSSINRECKLIVCPIPPPLINGLLVSSNETFGSKAVYRCLPSYKPQTLSILTCGESGLWEGHVSPCNAITCSEPIDIDHGSYRFDKPAVVDSIVEYFCEKGYILIGDKELRCAADETWWTEPPYCKPLRCPPFIDVTHSTLYQDETAGYMSIAVQTCDEGYSMSLSNSPGANEATFICDEYGKWNGSSFQCLPVTCPVYPPFVQYASYEVTQGSSYKSKALYECESGYAMVAEYDVSCGNNGQWSTTQLPKCEIISCGIPPIVKGADYEEYEFTYGSTVIYQCHQYHRLAGDNTIECLSHGSWSPVAFTCEAIYCNLMPIPENGRILNQLEDVFTVGSVLNFACYDGFSLYGNVSSTCQESGQWDSPPPLCQKVIGVCEETIAMKNAAPPPPGKFPGDQIHVKCQDGYEGRGDVISTCHNNGAWLLPSGTCQRVSCGRPQVLHRRNVKVVGRSFLYGDKVRYMCRYGFSPEQNPPILECLASGNWDKIAHCVAQCKQVCQNGGRCLGLNRCKCMPGWAGFKCHLPICIFPCLNGGRCEGPYKCGCPSGFSGSRCERVICPKPCQNGGRCSRSRKCHCLPGFYGTVCENKILSTSLNHGGSERLLQENLIYN